VPIAPKPAGRPEIGKLPDLCQTDWKTKPALEALPKEKKRKKKNFGTPRIASSSTYLLMKRLLNSPVVLPGRKSRKGFGPCSQHLGLPHAMR
jgi:hypothetical protein